LSQYAKGVAFADLDDILRTGVYLINNPTVRSDIEEAAINLAMEILNNTTILRKALLLLVYGHREFVNNTFY
jgi:hypothetical protein